MVTGLYTWQIEPFWLEFVKVKMPIKNLPDDLVGKTLMQISDMHVGKRFDHRYIIKSFNKAKEFNVKQKSSSAIHVAELNIEKLI